MLKSSPTHRRAGYSGGSQITTRASAPLRATWLLCNKLMGYEPDEHTIEMIREGLDRYGRDEDLAFIKEYEAVISD